MSDRIKQAGKAETKLKRPWNSREKIGKDLTAPTAPTFWLSVPHGINSLTAENLPEKSSALAKALVKEPRLREPVLRPGVTVEWHRKGNREAVPYPLLSRLWPI